jgi:calcineurin-like phosphoesterase family protein
MKNFRDFKLRFEAAAVFLTRGIAAAFIFVAALGVGGGSCFAQALTPVWVELGPNGAAVARVIVNSADECPTVTIDRTARRMNVRQPTPPGFRPACELAIPAAAKVATVNGQTLVLPTANPTKIVAFGDTGCRIKGKAVQNCDDPTRWPFKQIASQAAAEAPQLMIHVGDYLYRESPCPAAAEALCGGTPEGDNWDAWNADFFAPAAKLLAAVPWAFTRGNHEDCSRSWRGWFYYLDPRPWSGMCDTYSPPYMIKLGAFELVMLDSSAVNELGHDEDQITEYSGQLLSMHPQNAWLVDHHPFWGFASVANGLPPVPISAPLEEAWNKTNPKGYSLILSGHIHLFELLTLGEGRPEQLVVGDGGTDMAAPLHATMEGLPVRGVTTSLTETEHQFGYTLFTKEGAGWKFVLKDDEGNAVVSCATPGGGCTTAK